MNSYNDIYGEYIKCLNKRDIISLAKFVHDNVCYNNHRLDYQVIKKCWRKTLMKFLTCILKFNYWFLIIFI
ncbi:hypothetical protein SAMN04488132_10126 [Sediminibacterium ginsengisoli]|uniref:Uncharacterized protein n=1 Tax=Sediminibacterium ginsengisoli TaxID=413434 RepID=A0A1T4JP96_9BACT|nr:hypothetical protein SAMN04488132_10126 [Sediminibacterium ginsengisoli]